MEHSSWCRTLKHSDAAKRIADTFALHRLADPIGNTGRFFAANIGDGKSDNVLYDSRVDAIRHMKHNEMNYVYVQIVPGTMTVCDAEMLLSGMRKTYDARKKMIDRDASNGGLEVINRLTVEDQRAQNAGIPTNLIVPGRYQN